MTLEAKITALASAVGADVKALITKIGDMTSLKTTTKSNLVAALNELYDAIGDAGAQIDDTAGAGNKLVTWSADKMVSELATAKQQVKDDIIGGASGAYDTLLEIQQLLEGDASALAALTTAVNNRVRFDDAQTLNNTQKTQARANIGATSQDDVDNRIAAKVGDSEHDFVNDYNTAKA